MEKTKTFTIEKDFGDKTLQKVFVKESESSDDSVLLYDTMVLEAKQSEIICIVAEDIPTSKLMQLLCEIRQKKGVRLYIITSRLISHSFDFLKDNCIVREVADISGNYLICDKSAAFFYNSDLKGYAVKNSETVSKLHDIFIYEFWNKAEREFIGETKSVAEKTFDVMPVIGNDRVHINDKIINEATDFVAQDRVNDLIVSKNLYLNKKAIESLRDSNKNFSGKNIIYTDSSVIPLCKIRQSWYIIVGDINLSDDSSDKFFAVLMEKDPVFSNAYKLFDEYLYVEAVGKKIISLNDFTDIVIQQNSTEEKTVYADYKTLKKTVKMTDSDRESYFEKGNLFEWDKLSEKNKLSASVCFHIKMLVKHLTKGAVHAPIYQEYENFIKEYKNTINKISSFIDNLEKNVKECQEKDLDIKKLIERFKQKEEEITKIINNQKEINQKVKEISEQLEKAKKQRDKKEIEKTTKELQKYRESQKANAKKMEDFNKYKDDGKRLEQQLRDNNEKLQSCIGKKNKYISLLVSSKKISDDPQTVAECQQIKEIFSEFKFTLPSFDKPRYGTLYTTKGSYEYVLSNDDDIDNAEEEMKKAGLENVNFVDSAE